MIYCHWDNQEASQIEKINWISLKLEDFLLLKRLVEKLELAEKKILVLDFVMSDEQLWLLYYIVAKVAFDFDDNIQYA